VLVAAETDRNPEPSTPRANGTAADPGFWSVTVCVTAGPPAVKAAVRLPGLTVRFTGAAVTVKLTTIGMELPEGFVPESVAG
jgi:hypothetical protein